MGNESTTTIAINLRSSADTSGVEKMQNEYDALFSDLKQGIAETLSAGGADTKFISHVVDEFERLNRELKETGASGDVVAEKIAKLEQNLQQAAAAEERRIRQLKVNFEVALQEKDAQEEAAALQRRRREEDQLAMELEGIQLKKNTDLLEQEIMAKLKAERLAREAVGTAHAASVAVQGTRRSFGEAALVSAQFFDDAQYGLRAVVGKIPQMAAAFGLGTGLVGVIGIAAVAVNLLWDKFGGAKEAKADTDKVTASVAAMKGSMESAAKAADDLFKKDLAKYSSEVERVTTAWSEQSKIIKGILADQNEMARIQMEIANHKLEIQRQEALANANTEEQRKSINADFDYRKTSQNDAGKQAAAQRSLSAQEAEDAMLKQQGGNIQRRRDDAGARQSQNARGQDKFAEDFGDQSDQGRRVREADAAQRRVKELQEEQRKMEAFNQARPATTSGDAMARAAQASALQEKLDAANQDSSVKNAGIEGDKAALASGKGLTFKQIDEEATAKKDTPEGIGMRKVHEEAIKRQKQLDAESESLKKDIVQLDAELKKIKEAEVESAKQLSIRRLQVEEASLAAQEAAAKQATKEAEMREAAIQKARDEKARQLENDARIAEDKGDHKKAADLTNQAEWTKLPLDATAEQRRKAALDAQERRDKAKPTTVSGAELAVKADVVAANMGPAGKELAAAAAKIKDGASNKELEALLKAFNELTPALTSKFGNQDKLIAEMRKEIGNLKSQLRAKSL